MLIFDAHLDMAWNALEYNRNLELPVARIREFEKQFHGAYTGPNTVSWEALRKGSVAVTVSTLLPRLHRKDKALSHYQSREAAYAGRLPEVAGVTLTLSDCMLASTLSAEFTKRSQNIP